MVSPSLDVQGRQVHSKALVSPLEQMIGQLVRHDVVKVLARLACESNEESVKASRSVNKLGVEELIGKWDGAHSPSLNGSFLDQAETIGCQDRFLTSY